jgi:hypothetical protein
MLGAQECRQCGDVGSDAAGRVAGEEVRRRAPSGLIPEIDVGERLPLCVGMKQAKKRCEAVALLAVAIENSWERQY